MALWDTIQVALHSASPQSFVNVPRGGRLNGAEIICLPSPPFPLPLARSAPIVVTQENLRRSHRGVLWLSARSSPHTRFAPLVQGVLMGHPFCLRLPLFFCFQEVPLFVRLPVSTGVILHIEF